MPFSLANTFAVILFTWITALFSATGFAQAEPSAEELLKDADRSRGAAREGLTWNITVDTDEEGEKSQISYTVRVKGNDALAEASAPAHKKGEVMLFNDRNLWFFKPGTKRPVSVSSRQKLSGQAANGDIASTNYARDYDGKVVGTEVINGEETYKLELKAKAKNVTYDQIRYWVSKKQRVGVKAEFLTVSSKVFKSATFEYKRNIKHKDKDYPFITKMIITDALNAKKVTSISYEEPKYEDHADSIFNVNNLVR